MILPGAGRVWKASREIVCVGVDVAWNPVTLGGEWVVVFGELDNAGLLTITDSSIIKPISTRTWKLFDDLPPYDPKEFNPKEIHCPPDKWWESNSSELSCPF